MKGILLAGTLSLLSMTATAGTMGEAAPLWSRVFTVSLGPVWADKGDKQTFYLDPDIVKTYTATHTSKAIADGELFLGMQKNLNSHVQGQLGLAAAFTGNASVFGQIWDDADPQFNNHSYHYKIRHSHVAVKGKLLADRGYLVIPWISGSVGVGFNRAYHFLNNPLIFEALPNTNFASHTKTSFTYTVGVGVQRALSNNVQLGIGYEFADWGKSHLDRAWGQTLNTGLKRDHVYTNGFLVNITCVA